MSIVSVHVQLRLLVVEMVLTKTLLAMAVFTPFFYSIGMDQGDIGLSQMLFNAALLLVNVPTGWLADRFSRRWCNITGDLTIVASLLLYSQADSFADVIVCEIIFGTGAAFSHGADGGLLKGLCRLLAKGDSAKVDILLHRYTGRVWVATPMVQAALVFTGGLIGTDAARLAIALSAAPYMIGAICVLFVQDTGERYRGCHQNPFRDIAAVFRDVVSRRDLRWAMISFAVGREITHLMVWGMTPVLLLVSTDSWFTATGWAINSVLAVAGAVLARVFALRLPEWQRFTIPCVIIISSLVIMTFHLSAATVWLYGVMGLGMGWTGVALTPLVQRHAPDSVQSSALSAAGTFSQLLYLPLVWIVGLIGTIDIRLTMLAIAVLFLPLVLLTTVQLRHSAT